MAVNEIAEVNCTGCNACVDSCPMDVLRLRPDDKIAYIAHGQDCIVCFNCERDCPTDAIMVTPERAKPMPSPW